MGDKTFLSQVFTGRELALISNCQTYVEADPASLPGHALMIIIAKLAGLVGRMGVYLNAGEMAECVAFFASSPYPTDAGEGEFGLRVPVGHRTFPDAVGP